MFCKITRNGKSFATMTSRNDAEKFARLAKKSVGGHYTVSCSMAYLGRPRRRRKR